MDPVVSTAWLADRLGEVRIVDGSWHMPAEARDGRAEYLQRHVPGAVFFDIDHVADHDTDLRTCSRLPAFSKAAGELGLSTTPTSSSTTSTAFARPPTSGGPCGPWATTRSAC